MQPLTIAEMPARDWSLAPTFTEPIDRAGSATVAEYLARCGVTWTRAPARADVRLYKGCGTGVRPLSLLRAAAQLRPCDRRGITLIGEPPQIAPLAYLTAQRGRTLAVAPGERFGRLCYASRWVDPRLEGWRARLDRFCWIARPTPERIAMARTMEALGLPLDVYSKAPWPVPGWRGWADDELSTARRYRYRIACENYFTHGYHSEKLLLGIRSGCVTFYRADPALALPHAAGAYATYSASNLRAHRSLAEGVLRGMETFMFSKAWEVYSFRTFYDRIIEVAREAMWQ